MLVVRQAVIIALPEINQFITYLDFFNNIRTEDDRTRHKKRKDHKGADKDALVMILVISLLIKGRDEEHKQLDPNRM